MAVDLELATGSAALVVASLADRIDQNSVVAFVVVVILEPTVSSNLEVGASFVEEASAVVVELVAFAVDQVVAFAVDLEQVYLLAHYLLIINFSASPFGLFAIV